MLVHITQPVNDFNPSTIARYEIGLVMIMIVHIFLCTHLFYRYELATAHGFAPLNSLKV
ncbi:hypothetical protein BDY19DRAFT_930647 [Irpex rosettiformis]|uniref:Uncharacterized protein n=1 Tax=Irpex rosettiformis TaxID=378272 RepID=A0ACB8UB36_9APHY|nr:hypothetical protein BDY19DRAFT_930647 [Irpex rosettiformis]